MILRALTSARGPNDALHSGKPGTQPKVEQARAQAFRLGQQLLEHARNAEPAVWHGQGAAAVLEDHLAMQPVPSEVSALATPDPWGRAWYLMLTPKRDLWVVSAGPDGRLSSDLMNGRFGGDDLGSKIR